MTTSPNYVAQKSASYEIASNRDANTSPAKRLLGEVVDILDSRRVPINRIERDLRPGSVPYYGATGLVGSIDTHLFDEELVLLGEDGAPFLDFAKPKAFIIRGKSWVNNHAHVLRGKPGFILNAYLSHQLNAVNYSRFVSGTTRLKLPQGPMRQIPLFVPAIDQQVRVVAYLDEQLSRLDASVAALYRVQVNLKRYRASVLKSACEGRLVPTEAELARHEGRSFETGAQLLAQLLADRRVQLGAKGKYKETLCPYVSGSPQLPEGWCLATLDQLSSHLTSGSRDWSPFYDRGSSTFLMAQNVRMGQLDLSMKQRVDPPKEDASRARSQVEVDDLLVTIVGANAGDVCRVPAPLREHFVCQSVALVRPTRGAMSKYLEAFLIGSENGQKQFESFMYGQGRPHLSFDQLRATVVPLPPLAEQHRIVAEADRRLSLIRVAEAQVSANLARAQRLRQSILQAAFRTPAQAGQ